MLIGKIRFLGIVDVTTHSISSTSTYKHADVVNLERCSFGSSDTKLYVSSGNLVYLALRPVVTYYQTTLCLASGIIASPFWPHSFGVRTGVLLHIHALKRLRHYSDRPRKLTFVVLLQSPIGLDSCSAFKTNDSGLDWYFYGFRPLY